MIWEGFCYSLAQPSLAASGDVRFGVERFSDYARTLCEVNELQG